ncbi:MAG: 2-isopropylmalate synthase [Gemmatimonadetes bacterium]|nr:2-isopropylmalate synthase [Gemmatimonadota bacterium]
MDRVVVFDTTLRDGEQSPGATMTASEKLKMAQQLDQLGVDVIEAGFPISSPDELASVQGIARSVKRPIVAALARCTPGDIDTAALALARAARPRIHVFIATSDLHLQHKLGITRAQCLEHAAAAVERARRRVDDVEFSAEDATRSDHEFLAQVFDAAVRAGATTINVPDTVGYTYPSEYHGLISYLRSAVPGLANVVISVHCHNDLGLAVANSLMAVEAGARQVECTINGIGERAGNAALEEIVMALKVRRDKLPFCTAVHTEELYRASQLLSRITGIHPQPNKAIVGRNAFAHEAGIHQAGMLKRRTTYEIMQPEMVGAPATRLVLGKHSGRNALAQRCRDLGYQVVGGELERVHQEFKRLADKKREILDEDLLVILQERLLDGGPTRYRLLDLEASSGLGTAWARVRIALPNGDEPEARCEGDGPIAAAFAAVESVVGRKVELEDLNIRAATPGRDALGEVSLRVTIDGRSFSGRAHSTDIVHAAVEGYLHALNKASVAARPLPVAAAAEDYLWGV